MIRILIALKAREDLDRQAFSSYYFGRHIPSILESHQGIVDYIANVADDQALLADYPNEGGPPLYDGLTAITLKKPQTLKPAGDESQFLRRLDIFRVDEVVQWDDVGSWPVGSPSPGFKIISFSRRRAELSKEEFIKYYRDVHSVLAREHHPGVKRYVQYFITQSVSSGAPNFDAVTELFFPKLTDYTEGMYASKESIELVNEDVRNFMELDSVRMITATQVMYRRTHDES